MLMFFTSFTIMYYPEKENLPLKEEVEGCAGIIATGSVVKDGRSIHWKSRHSSSTDNFCEWIQGDVNSFFVITDDTHLGRGYQGMNEEGLSVGNLVCSAAALQNVTGYTSGVKVTSDTGVCAISLL
ncbi:MAG: hypothetical protein U9Q88_02630 [Bacillota bacterium]|nr:hypothetical protein [Bacillota bacterium]